MMLWWNLSKQQNIWMMCPPGDRETTDFTHLNTVILFIEEEVEEEVEEVEEEESGFRKGRWKDPMEVLARGNGQDNNVRPQQQTPTDRPQPARQEDEWSLPPTVERRDDAERWQTMQSSPPVAPPPTEERLFTNWSSEGSPRERVNQQIQLARSVESRRTVNQMEQPLREPGDDEVLRYVLSDVTTTPSA